jgi:hypothetical protein
MTIPNAPILRGQALFLALLGAFTGATNAAPPKVDGANFETLHALLQPTTAEIKWQQIPWRTNLWQARVDAAKTGKPIYLWEMDGHPLGCT